jgi:hypothetical protein
MFPGHSLCDYKKSCPHFEIIHSEEELEGLIRGFKNQNILIITKNRIKRERIHELDEETKQAISYYKESQFDGNIRVILSYPRRDYPSGYERVFLMYRAGVSINFEEIEVRAHKEKQKIMTSKIFKRAVRANAPILVVVQDVHEMRETQKDLITGSQS